MMARLLSGRGSVVLSGQVATALAEALMGKGTLVAELDATSYLGAPVAAKRSRAARLLYRAALAVKPYLQPVLFRVEARIGTAVSKSRGVVSLQNEVAAAVAAVGRSDGVAQLQTEIAALRDAVDQPALRAAVDQSDGIARLQTDIAALRAAVDQSDGIARLQTDIAALRAAADQSDSIARLQNEVAALGAHVEILLRRSIFPVGAGMLAARNRYGYLVLPTTDLANVGYLANGVLPEQGSLAVLEKLLMPGDVFVDLGANVGLFTLAAAQQVGATGRVHAVEPASDLVAALGSMAALNQIASFVTIHPVAIGAAEGEAELFLAYTSGHNSLFAEEAGLASIKCVSPRSTR